MFSSGMGNSFVAVASLRPETCNYNFESFLASRPNVITAWSLTCLQGWCLVLGEKPMLNIRSPRD